MMAAAGWTLLIGGAASLLLSLFTPYGRGANRRERFSNWLVVLGSAMTMLIFYDIALLKWDSLDRALVNLHKITDAESAAYWGGNVRERVNSYVWGLLNALFMTILFLIGAGTQAFVIVKSLRKPRSLPQAVQEATS